MSTVTRYCNSNCGAVDSASICLDSSLFVAATSVTASKAMSISSMIVRGTLMASRWKKNTAR